MTDPLTEHVIRLRAVASALTVEIDRYRRASSAKIPVAAEWIEPDPEGDDPDHDAHQTLVRPPSVPPPVDAPVIPRGKAAIHVAGALLDVFTALRRLEAVCMAVGRALDDERRGRR